MPLKDTIESHSPSHIVKLLRNIDKSSLTPVSPKVPSNPILPLNKFQEFSIKDSESNSPVIKIPQKEAVLYDCVKNTEKTVKPPDIIIGQYSPYKDHYQKLSNVPKAFHKKQGLFGYFIDKSDRQKKLEEVEKIVNENPQFFSPSASKSRPISLKFGGFSIKSENACMYFIRKYKDFI